MDDWLHDRPDPLDDVERALLWLDWVYRRPGVAARPRDLARFVPGLLLGLALDAALLALGVAAWHGWGLLVRVWMR